MSLFKKICAAIFIWPNFQKYSRAELYLIDTQDTAKSRSY